MDTEPLVFVGIDWASTGDPVQRAFAHDASGIGAMVDWLGAQAEQPNQVAVAIETPHGPIVEALMDRGIAVFAINPKQLDRFRDRFSPSGAKDDRRDALVLASSLRTDRHCFRRVEAMDPAVVELREWSRMADELKGERVRLANRASRLTVKKVARVLAAHRIRQIAAADTLAILQRPAHADWRGPCHQTQRQVPPGRDAAGLLQPIADRGLSLGQGRHPA